MSAVPSTKALRPKRILVILAYGEMYARGVFIKRLFSEFGARGHDVRIECHNLSHPRWHRIPGLARLFPFFNEWRLAWLARSYDVVFLQKIVSRRLIALLRSHSRARLILDFGDAMWMPQQAGPGFDELLRLVDDVSTDNEWTRRHVLPLNPKCAVVPDLAQVEEFDRRRRPGAKGSDGRLVIGWVGSPGTLYNLYIVWEALERLFSRHDHIHLRLVGAGRDRRQLPAFEQVRFSTVAEYDQGVMIDEVLNMDIGLFPLQDTDYSRVRGVLKAAVYMAGEAAVVGSPVGQTTELIEHGTNGMLASTSEEWERSLERLITEPDFRRRIASNGLRTARQQFAVPLVFERLRAVVEDTK